MQLVLGARQSPWQRLVKRMTRFFTKLDADGSYRTLKEVCEKMGYGWKKSCTNQVGIGVQNRGGGVGPHRAVASANNLGDPPFTALLQVTISTTDRRNNKLIFKVNLVEMESKILVDFRLSKVSCGWGGQGGCTILRDHARWARGRARLGARCCETVEGDAGPCEVGCKMGAGQRPLGAR